MSFSVAILAGGESRRLGRNKALEPLGGMSVVARVAQVLQPLTADLFIVGGAQRDFASLQLPHVADQFPDQASLVGLFSALAACRNDLCLVAAADLPFASAALASHMAGLADGSDAVVPHSAQGNQPLFALYHKHCAAHFRERIAAGKMSIQDALAGLDVRFVEPSELDDLCDPEVAFLNLNSEAELAVAREIIAADGAAGCTAGYAAAAQRPPLVCFVGKKDSGKTTFLESLVPALRARGLRVAYIKHDAHGFSMDREGTDTWRLAQAGAVEIAISSPEALALLSHPAAELSLNEIRTRISGAADIIIAEGFKSAAVDRIEISRRARSSSLACRESDLVAVISDREDAATAAPLFALEDFEGVADLIMDRYLGPPGKGS